MSAACAAIQPSARGSRGHSASSTNKPHAIAKFCIANRRLSAMTLAEAPLRAIVDAVDWPWPGSMTCGLDLATVLDAEQALRSKRKQRDDHREGGSGLVLRPEISACEVLGNADHQRADDRAGDRIKASEHRGDIALDEHLVHHLGADVDDGRGEHAGKRSEKSCEPPGQHHDEAHGD